MLYPTTAIAGSPVPDYVNQIFPCFSGALMWTDYVYMRGNHLDTIINSCLSSLIKKITDHRVLVYLLWISSSHRDCGDTPEFHTSYATCSVYFMRGKQKVFPNCLLAVFVLLLSIFALTPAHSRSLPLTPAHSRSLPLTPAHSRSLSHTPAHSRSLPLTPAHSRSLLLTPARADVRVSTGEWQKPKILMSVNIVEFQ